MPSITLTSGGMAHAVGVLRGGGWGLCIHCIGGGGGAESESGRTTDLEAIIYSCVVQCRVEDGGWRDGVLGI